MPAEWQPQAATWLSWPHNEETWPTNLTQAQQEFVEFAATIANYQPVNVLCVGKTLRDAASQLRGITNLDFIDIPTNDAWARDYAPTFVRDVVGKKLTAVDWHYNAWGGKYPPFQDDQQVATRVADYLGIECVSPSLCFEGGAVEINDSGIVLSTRSCAVDPNRNPGKSLAEIETIFQQFLGAKGTIWLAGNAIAGDDTDGHIDQLARYTDDQTIVYAWCDDEHDEQSRPLANNLSDLESGLAEQAGCCYRLIPLPIPTPIIFEGRRIPASYCNFLIANGLVVVPQFGQQSSDQRALDLLQSLFPDRHVVGLNSIHLAVGLGSFHCLSQQQPIQPM